MDSEAITKDTIAKGVEALAEDVSAERGDEESWHADADLILLAALRAIASGAVDPADIAKAALKADDIEFARWYA